MSDYSNQDRGALSEYEAYFAGMDASMQQKIALTTAHFPARGRIADMGSGSGSGTYDLARLYSGLELVGVDINPVTVEYSNAHYQAPNLKFVVGDIADRVFDAESLDGILDSSVLHHVTSFNDFDIGQIRRTLTNQIAQLKTGGILIIRDFVVPDQAESQVFLDLPVNDGADGGSIPQLSTATLFEVFARDFRSSVNRDYAVPFERSECPRKGFKRFRTSLRYVAEFVLRKDYRNHWEPELLEEYTYYSQRDFEDAFREKNLRIVVSMPLWNPWIVANRFRDKFFISTENETRIHYPPTNFLIVGEKVGKNEGVFLCRTDEPAGDPSFLNLNFYRHRESGAIYELAERPNTTIDLLPWFENSNGRLFVLAKKDFPRPIVNALDEPNLNRASFSGYITEPISALEHAGAARGIGTILKDRAGIEADEIVEIGEANHYFTSPGGIDERVTSHLVRIDRESFEAHAIANYSSFSSSGSVREMDALQVLRASHVGGMFDARLEINIYRLLRRLGRSPGNWIGASIEPAIQEVVVEVGDDLAIGTNAAFEIIADAEPTFLDHRRATFAETDSKREILAQSELEFIIPKKYSKNTVSAIPFIRTAHDVLVGIEIRDLPAPQNFSGNSRLACVPAWRLPRTIGHKFEIDDFLRERFPLDFRADVNRVWELGGAYFTSAGITPEIVYPTAVELDANRIKETDLMFIRLRDLVENQGNYNDAHLLISLNRLDHAFERRV